MARSSARVDPTQTHRYDVKHDWLVTSKSVKRKWNSFSEANARTSLAEIFFRHFALFESQHPQKSFAESGYPSSTVAIIRTERTTRYLTKLDDCTNKQIV